MAFPGGNIVIYSGLLKASSSVEEVVGVMAHEIQHVLHRHSLRRMGRSLGMSAVISMIFGDLGGLGQIADLAVGVKLLSHDREQEREADRGAVELLLKAKVNPEPFGLFFKKLEEKETAIDKAFSWLSTHPASAERSEQVRKLYEKSPDWQKFEPLQLEWDKN
jgi:predicted Zn-dependent protease